MLERCSQKRMEQGGLCTASTPRRALCTEARCSTCYQETSTYRGQVLSVLYFTKWAALAVTAGLSSRTVVLEAATLWRVQHLLLAGGCFTVLGAAPVPCRGCSMLGAAPTLSRGCWWTVLGAASAPSRGCWWTVLGAAPAPRRSLLHCARWNTCS